MLDDVDEHGDKRVFGIQYVTFDKGRKAGGEIRTLKGVQKLGSGFNQKARQMINVRAPGNTSHPYPIHIRLITAIDLTGTWEPIYW